jgi:hypothetical protein
MRFAYRSRVFAVLCALAGTLLASPGAHAAGVSPTDATSAQKKEATDHFMAGRRAIASRDWARATSELRASLQVVDSPNAHLELARALRESGQLGDAWVEFWHASETATRLASSDNRYSQTAEAATSEREELAAKLAFVDVSVEHAPADMSLKVGDRVVPPEDTGAPIAVPPGPVDVVVSNGAGAELARKTVIASVGKTTAVSLVAQAPPPPTAGPTGKAGPDTSDDEKPGGAEPQQPPMQAVLPPPTDRTKLRPYAYVAGGIGAAGLITFTVSGLLSNATYNDLKNACSPGPGCPPGKQGEIDRGVTEQTVANVGLGVGLAGLAAGVTMFLLSRPPAAPSASTALVVGPGYFGMRGEL